MERTLAALFWFQPNSFFREILFVRDDDNAFALPKIPLRPDQTVESGFYSLVEKHSFARSFESDKHLFEVGHFRYFIGQEEREAIIVTYRVHKRFLSTFGPGYRSVHWIARPNNLPLDAFSEEMLGREDVVPLLPFALSLSAPMRK